ncbi:MAG: glycosyltransferase [Hyphomicrobium sp.]|nr:glycosyltransferase [Hyphomicrobium sp.]
MASSVLGGSLDKVRKDSAPKDGPLRLVLQLDHAVNALRRDRPAMSAGNPLVPWQRAAIYGVSVVMPAAVALIVTGRGDVIALALTALFAVIVLVRVAALWQLVFPNAAHSAAYNPIPDANLPRYSVLVPVFREVAIAPALVQAMGALDYPTDKLEIIFITEASDPQTRAALSAASPPAHMQIITVPAGQPQTKPRALNYALQAATGELIAVFDAEDVPDPQQLRKAAAMFATGGSELACVQARLSIYNPEVSFWTRQFTLEYAALFEAILPALERLGLPILLGGTSNHFRRSALAKVGAWDPFNVTEDADLGVRLARHGYRVDMLDSDTWEEAPRTVSAWLGQRTRWLKGWMQTYLVHMRHPRELFRDLGAWRVFGVQVMLGGMILSALVHPWFYLVVTGKMMLGHPMLPESGSLWMVCWFNFVVGHAVGIALALISAWRSQGRVPLGSALQVPGYWLLISIASYRALWDLYTRPFYWQKTAHAARPVTSTHAPT